MKLYTVYGLYISPKICQQGLGSIGIAGCIREGLSVNIDKVTKADILRSHKGKHPKRNLFMSIYIQSWSSRLVVGSLKMNTALEYSTRVAQEGDRRCKKSTLNDLAYLTPLRIPLMNPV
jgi:hypothetical protein